MKSILFLTQVLPYPLDAGPKVRAYYVLRHLAQRHEVTLLSFTRASDPPAALEHLRSLCARVVMVPMRRARWKDALTLLKSLVSGTPFLITRDESGAMETALRQVVGNQRFDAVHADQLWMAPYALKAQSIARDHGIDPLTVLDQHNAVFQVPRRMAEGERNPLARWLLQREARQMAAFEARVCRQFKRVVWVTQEDFTAVQALGGVGDLPGRVIPICVAPEEVRPVTVGGQPSLLFVGGMHWLPNAEGMTWFAREVWGRVRERVPEARLAAVGKAPPAALHGLAGVEAPGYVEDVEPFWAGARAFIVPLKSAGGMRIKILDAWAHSVPVISTSIGAEGIACVDGEDILLADTPQAFADAAVRLLQDLALAQRIGAAGRAAVEARYDWRQVYAAWDEVYPR